MLESSNDSIIDKNNSLLSLSNKITSSKISNSQKSLSKYVYFNLFFVLLLYLLLYINYTYTKSSFASNSYVLLPVAKLCAQPISALDLCLSSISNTDTSTCDKQSNDVESCYDSVYKFNKNCNVYISEIALCMREGRKCSTVLTDMKECAANNGNIKFDDIVNVIQVIN